ncbi:ABSCISIC ACID-INSENSITIVE 5-like protein 3 [Prosopis cineraria]|uniref:ABSCISIC ACID-INSENSITIVE 5-like protein 3 n=1 Tax=Prosopis cineraria TaxID=364024 RepID=UPI00240EABC5|nr:ABSCISIC ACID-INSENSITIVE 5-like protein 3 [Prosopis cineraria]
MVSTNRAEPEAPHPDYVTFRRHGSMPNQNFDEFQSILEHKCEKPLFRMNFDELLNNTTSTESGQITQNLPLSSSPVSHFLDLNATMSKKTLDQVWSDFVVQEHVNRIDNQVNRPSLKETTVADLMVREEAMNNGKQDHIGADVQPLITIDPTEMVSQQANWMQMQLQIPVGINYSDLGVRKSVSVTCYSEKVLPLGISLPITCSSKSQVEAGATERKRRYSDETLNENFERKQKRMIKNRESAARSRARKQEYTKNMVEKRDRLEQRNCWLKKIKEAEARFTKLTPKYQLRRTSSATF